MHQARHVQFGVLAVGGLAVIGFARQQKHSSKKCGLDLNLDLDLDIALDTAAPSLSSAGNCVCLANRWSSREAIWHLKEQITPGPFPDQHRQFSGVCGI